MLDDIAQKAIIAKLANMDKETKSKLAQTMIAPLRSAMNYRRRRFADEIGEFLPHGCVVIEFEEEEAV